MIVQDLIDHVVELQGHALIVTSKDPTPVQLALGLVTQCNDLRTTQEEADTIIIIKYLVLWKALW